MKFFVSVSGTYVVVCWCFCHDNIYISVEDSEYTYHHENMSSRVNRKSAPATLLKIGYKVRL